LPTAPAISLPKGGGAIRGIGEKFSSNPATGTATASVPIPTSAGRGGHGPGALQLSYSGSAGNGPWGIGWSLEFGAVTRKTDKGLPRYDDGDTFIMNGSEDLVPRFRTDDDGSLVATAGPAGRQFVSHVDHRDGWRIQRFAPRVESKFARIEMWTNEADPTDVHWKSTAADGLVTLFGLDDTSRVYDTSSQAVGKRIFSWLLCQTYDTKGNCAVYTYKREDSSGVDVDAAHEANRTPEMRRAHLYAKSVKYGNRLQNRDLSTWKPFDAGQLPDDTWMFELVMDYGEHDLNDPRASDVGPGTWPCRQDPVSNCRATFETRMYRLCRRILMFHHFPTELGRQDCLISSTTFVYDENPIATYLIKVVRAGYRQLFTPSDPNPPEAYVSQTLPPLEFEYSRLPTPEELETTPVRVLSEAATQGLPAGFAAPYQSTDLDGEGLSGVLFESDGAWYYKRNVSANNYETLSESHDQPHLEPLFLPPVVLPRKPNASLQDDFQLLSLDGNGQLDVVDFSSASTAGYYERSRGPEDNGWEAFRTFHTFPNVNVNDANAKFVDLTGDGLADILITESERMVWYESIGEKGFLAGQTLPVGLDEDKGPRLLFSDPEHSVFLADMSGDGMQDLVRISNPGCVCYWPGLGYGRFGSKITMSNAIPLDRPDMFDPKRVRLVDIDGNGTSDMLYLDIDQVRVFRNQSGNSWSAPQVMASVPGFDSLTSVQPMDLFGRGTMCLVWSRSGPSHSRTPVSYVDLMNGVKPHLLMKAQNNLGAETRYTYTPSTEFYLNDEMAGKPWMTKISFPVHCVSKIEVYDHVSRSKFVSKYAYRHGYYDGIEREFRGFALAEQWDTEQHETFSLGSANPDEVVNWDAAFVAPPVYTKQFFHTGAYLDGEDLGIRLAKEFYGVALGSEGATPADFISARSLETSFPDSLSPDEMREACRSLKGLALRQEVYCQDGSPLAGIPFSVSSHSYTAICLQPKALDALHSVWISHPRDAISVEYDREATESPRITHTMSLEQNRFAADTKSLSIAYGKARSDLTGYAKLAQERTIITYTEQDYTNFVDEADAYVMSVPAENRAYELSGLPLPPESRFFQLSDLAINDFEAIRTLPVIPSEQSGDPNEKWKRLVHQQRILYHRDDLTAVLPVGRVQSLILPSHSESLAYTAGMLEKFRRGSENLIPDVTSTMKGAGYIRVLSDSNWWIRSGRQFYHPDFKATREQELSEARLNFFYPQRFEDNLGWSTIVKHDQYNLLPLAVIDHIGNVTRAYNDYRTLQPHTVTDINGNQTQVKFDAFMRVVGSAVMGRPGEGLGDSLNQFTPDLSDGDRDEFFRNPNQDIARRLLGTASSRIIYDNSMFHRDPQQRSPAYEATLARETHVPDLPMGSSTRVRIKFTYTDGFGREIQQKTIQEPGPLKPGGPPVPSRWVGSGWKIFNNKGNEVQQFEPFFDDTHKFNFAKVEGVSSIVLYDAAQRPAATLRPDHAWSKNAYGSWSQKIYDTGDVVLVSDPRTDGDVGALFRSLDPSLFLPSWYNARKNGAKGRNELAAATKSAAYHDTPTVTCADAMGRPFMTTIDNGPYGKYTEMSVLDLDGNKVQTIDSMGRITQKSEYNLVGHCYHGTSMDTGESWTLCDAQDSSILDWDTRGHRLRTEYDPLKRVRAHFLSLPGANSGSELMVDSIVYGDEANLPPARNARGKHYKQYDQSGVLTMPFYDFKGNLLVQEQQLCQNYKTIVDWTTIADVPLEPEIHRSRSSYDALNRHVSGTSPDGTLTVNEYNEAGFVEKMRVNSRGERDALTDQLIFKEYVTNVDYDAQGRRTMISYGNGTTSTYEYDAVTSNLASIRTTGPSGAALQSLSYTYDIVSNVVHIDDEAQQAVFFRNQIADPGTDCSYDPIGRLIEFRGRERLGENSAPGPQDKKPSSLGASAPNAVGMYSEVYAYDSANNILSVRHSGSQAANPGWTRRYNYEDSSQLEPGKKSNKLTSTAVGNTTDTYGYEGLEGRAGLMTSMSHLSAMTWDFRDNLSSTASQTVNGALPETTYYVYDATGRRVRKVTERQQGGDDPQAPPRKLKETLYLTGLDIYRKFAGDGATITLEKQTFKVTHADKNVALIERRTISTVADSGNAGDNLPPERLDRYQLDDHLSSIQIELDDAGNPISYEEYSAYGTTTYSSTKTELHIDKRYRHA
ncbi:SpvB domain-containing protein, partial [Cercophora newfieldiana]